MSGLTEGGVELGTEDLEERLRFLDDLRASGITNMFGAAPYLQGVYPELNRAEARAVLTHWMQTFGERQG